MSIICHLKTMKAKEREGGDLRLKEKNFLVIYVHFYLTMYNYKLRR